MMKELYRISKLIFVEFGYLNCVKAVFYISIVIPFAIFPLHSDDVIKISIHISTTLFIVIRHYSIFLIKNQSSGIIQVIQSLSLLRAHLQTHSLREYICLTARSPRVGALPLNPFSLPHIHRKENLHYGNLSLFGKEYQP
jgi:hypothetical protein